MGKVFFSFTSICFNFDSWSNEANASKDFSLAISKNVIGKNPDRSKSDLKTTDQGIHGPDLEIGINVIGRIGPDTGRDSRLENACL